MYTNASSAFYLTLETLGLSNAYVYPAFLFVTLVYLFIMAYNLLILTTIVCSKKLYKPMYILLFNLPISDIVGATAFFPQLILSIVTQSRQISYPACITQVFLLHFSRLGNVLILSAMAYDRYVAICSPLRYNAIITSHKLVRIITSIWLLNLLLIGTLILLLARFRLCRTHIVHLFCNIPSLLKLACGDTRVIKYYGLFVIALAQGGPWLLILYTYVQIIRICVKTNEADARRKAFQTCSSHLVVYLILQINTVVTINAHYIENTSPFVRRGLGVSVLVSPPLLDPIIYGLKTKELKESIKLFLKRNVGN